MSLATRIFLITALLVALAVASAVFLTILIGNQIAEGAVRRTLTRSSSIQAAFEEERLANLGLMARILASDPNFISYIASSYEAGDFLSILDQLDERQLELGFDFAILLDADGLVIARSDDPNASGQDLSTVPMVERAFEEFEAQGVWSEGEQLFNTVAVPLDSGGVLAGYLILGYAIDELAALELRRISDTEVSFFAGGDGPARLVATTLESRLGEELLARVAERPDLLAAVVEGTEATNATEITLGERSWLTLIRPLEDAAGAPVGTSVSLASLAQQRQPYRRIGTVLAVVGALAILASSLLSYLLVSRLLKPVKDLVVAARQASEGDYEQQIESDGTDEVGQLAKAFGKLLSELREKRDMELYINELSRTLPEPEAAQETEAIEPAQAAEVVLLGVELRDYARTRQEGREPRQILDQLSRDMRMVSAAITRRRGKIESLLGHRLLASFRGDSRVQQAIAATAEIATNARFSTPFPTSSGTRSSQNLTHTSEVPRLASPAVSGPPLATALALVSGTHFSGTVGWEAKPIHACTGAPVEQLEGLMRVARAGDILLAEGVYLSLQGTLADAGLELPQLRSSVSESPLYSLGHEHAERLIVPELSTTRAMPTTDAVAAPTLSGVVPGSLLGDRFEILSVLGRGGMGVVYKARDRSLDELVALKMLRQLVFGDGEQLGRLKDELKLARKIGHANVLRTFDFGEVDGVPFITMEYVRGITLRELLDQSGRLPLTAGLRVARQLCRGLAAAHAQSVLHRDIKPENLIIEHTGNAKLMDFGIARPIQRMKTGQTQPGSLIGTPFYLAPEQLEGGEPDERADIYACGVVFYEIFTGHLPFAAKGSLMQIITQKLNQPPTPPREHWPAMPEALEKIVLRCLEIDREARYRDVATLVEELERIRA